MKNSCLSKTLLELKKSGYRVRGDVYYACILQELIPKIYKKFSPLITKNSFQKKKKQKTSKRPEKTLYKRGYLNSNRHMKKIQYYYCQRKAN